MGLTEMRDYKALNKTDWFIEKMESSWLSLPEIVDLAAQEFPGVSRKTLYGTIGQYWSDSVNPKWSTYKAIDKRGLETVERSGRRHIQPKSLHVSTHEKSTNLGGGQSGGPPNQQSWDEGRNALVQFLRDLKTILRHVLEQRIVVDPKNPTKIDKLFSNNLKDADSSVDEVIKELEADKTGRWFAPLKDVGLTGKALWLKLRDLYESISTKSLSIVLEIADTIAGSLAEVFHVLEPVKELKEIAEARVKYGGDKPLLTILNLSGREQIDWDSKVSE
jgi:hypothetical protein